MAEQTQGQPSPEISLYTVEEACRRLRIGRSTLYQLVKDQRLPVRKVGGATRIRSDELDAYIESLPRLDTSEEEAW